jgi:hypothetical protein
MGDPGVNEERERGDHLRWRMLGLPRAGSWRTGRDRVRASASERTPKVIRGYSALAALCALAVLPAADQKRVVVRGAGSESCAQYIQAYDQYRSLVGSGATASQAITTYLQYEAWIQGYLFGVDSWNRGVIRDFDRAGMQLWVYGYCQQHSAQLIADAALAFYRGLGGPSPTGGNAPN